MQIETLSVRLRPRSQMEAADLGVRVCQAAAGSVYRCYAMVAVPLFALALGTVEISPWLPPLVIWWSKPWLDRTILFVLSRAVFGQRTSPRDIWRAQRQVWWGQLLLTLTVQRFSFWRSLTQPVYQLEGGSFFKARARVAQIRRRSAGSAFLVTQVFFTCEGALWAALISLIFWFAPKGQVPDILEVLGGERQEAFSLILMTASAATVLFLEPFYVAAGFAMYLNRRAELEAWDIEQEFRRAFARNGTIGAVAVVCLLALALPAGNAAAHQSSPPPAARAVADDAEIMRALETVRADPNLATERTIKTLQWKDSKQRKRSGLPGWLAWIVGLFSWLERSARYLVWGTVMVLVGFLIKYAMGLAQRYRPPVPHDVFDPPTHVRDLDIRPETLPADIGSAARALWDRGEHRAALALLYRGLLSRLAHVHGVPIRDSSTEGDCLELASSHLSEGRREYVSHLMRVWQRAVYGREEVAGETVYGLCENFASVLDRRSQPAGEPGGATA